MARRRDRSTFAKIHIIPILAAGLMVTIVLFFVAIPIRAQLPAFFDPVAEARIDPRFETYYEAIGGIEILGATISEAFVDADSNVVVQYFQNGRLELSPAVDGGLEVKTSALSVLLGAWESPLPSQSAAEGCQLFQETGHQVCHAFLKFYRLSGGPAIMGYPISEFKVENGQTVQYFQYFRLDWVQVEEGQGEVQIAPLGKMFLQRQQSVVDGPLVAEMYASVTLKYGVTRTSGEQIVYLIVRDGQGEALQGAQATLVASFVDGKRTFIMPATDRKGASQVALRFEDQRSGNTVRLEIAVVYESLTATTRDSFLVYGTN